LLLCAATLAAVALVAGGMVGGPATASDTRTGRASDPGAGAIEQPLPPQEAFRTIVIDPGHGGAEVGAVGPTGLTEKELVFDIANRLSDLIVQRLGLEVRLTRDGDVYKALEDRTAFANNLKADVFVSIHANSYRGRGVHGAETFFLSDRATDDDARRVALIENDALELQGPAAGDDELQMLLWDMAQTAHLQESGVLAEMIQTNFNLLGGTTDRGIKQAPFRVLKGANMPAVLVEVGFLSNAEEERLLADPAYRQRIADVLFRSLSEYRRRQAMLLGGSPR
jgi:N-acetylmuramoyl-L-alanine amidase